MKYSSSTPYIAAFIIFRKDDKVAFVLRENTGWMDGYYDLPAGKVEKGESFIEAAIREAKEEVGIDLKPENLSHVLTLHRFNRDEDMSWVDIVFEAHDWAGELYNAESGKHSELAWLDLNNLPQNIPPNGRVRLDQIRAGNRYAEYGWQ